MKIAIVGASASGIYLALQLLATHPSLTVTLFDQEERIGKKIAATGNGRCNILHHRPSPERYDHPDVAAAFLARFPFERLVETLASFGVPLKREGDLYYPRCASAPGLVRFFAESLSHLGAEVRLGTKILDYQASDRGVRLRTDCGEETFDECVFAIGGKSGKRLGSDGSMFPIFQKHGYALAPFRPGLCPIVTRERHPSLQGQRVDGLVRIETKGKRFEESGQILFKKDGLSGIVMFNAEAFLMKNEAPRGTEIVLDLFPEWEEEQLETRLRADADRPHFLEAYFPLEVARHFAEIAKRGTRELARALKHWTFHFEAPYPFEDSQVTLGGLSWENVDARSLRSRVEKHVHFAGECLDMAGDCGGYNLTWCLLTALAIGEDFDEILRG